MTLCRLFHSKVKIFRQVYLLTHHYSNLLQVSQTRIMVQTALLRTANVFALLEWNYEYCVVWGEYQIFITNIKVYYGKFLSLLKTAVLRHFKIWMISCLRVWVTTNLPVHDISKPTYVSVICVYVCKRMVIFETFSRCVETLRYVRQCKLCCKNNRLWKIKYKFYTAQKFV